MNVFVDRRAASFAAGGPPAAQPRLTFRKLARGANLLLRMGVAALDYLLTVAPRVAFGLPGQAEARAEWLQRCCLSFGKAFRLRVRIKGAHVPCGGLIVSNHLSYLDVLAFGAVLPCAFVSKKEVRSWPLIGALTRMAGTLFIDRERRGDVSNLEREMRRLSATGLPLILFPEGTSSNGSEILPFKSSPFAAACRRGDPVTPAHIVYSLPAGEGAPGNEICYWGDMNFFPHLLNALGKTRIDALISFAEPQPASPDRKATARDAQEQVLRLHRQATPRLTQV